MAQFKQFIITQFNIRLWDKDKRNVSTYTEEWLSKRFILFDKYCFPSVLKQTNQNFIWICLFDKDTPEHYLKKVKEYQESCPQLQAYYLSSEETKEWLEYTRSVIRRQLDANDQYIITTNLDNDDSIHIEMMNRIALEFEKDHLEALYSFNYGFQCLTESDIILKMKYPHNHHLTLIEKNTPDFKTVKFHPHGRARKFFKTIDIKSEPYWIEFVHSSNVSNDIRITSRIKYYPVFKTTTLENFGLNITFEKKSNIINFFVKIPVLFTKTAIRKLKKKMQK